MGAMFKLFSGLLISLSLINYGEPQRTTGTRITRDMTVPQIIAQYGYPVEKHRVKTEDGYILQMHRIPAGKRAARRSEPSSKGKKAVLIMHGMGGHSGDFIIMGPERSIGFLLADAGYDVWIGNMRGTIFSAHQNLTKQDPQFWEFSFHEHGKYDAPALIDRALKVTGLPKLLYIGYSMGCTAFYTMMSERPEYNEKLIGFIGLAPGVYIDNMKPMADLLINTIDIGSILRSQGMMSFSMPTELIEFVIGNVCNFKHPKEDVCLRTVYSIVGEDYEQTDVEMMQIVMRRAQPISFRQLEHFGKIALTGVFTSWDDGLRSAARPYNLSNVKIPVVIMYGENDMLTHKSQVMRLADTMNSTGVLVEARAGCSWPKFNHLDFVFAKDVGKLFNRPFVKVVKQFFDKYDDTSR